MLVTTLSLEVLLPPVLLQKVAATTSGSVQLYMAVLSGRVCTKICYHRLLLRKVFSLSRVKTQLSEQPKQCW